MLANRVRMVKSGFSKKDPFGSPGPKYLISGDMDLGFFGEVSAADFISGDSLASAVRLTAGTAQHSTAGWLKFALDGKIIFVAKKPIRHSISWNAINRAKCVYDEPASKTVEVGGLSFRATLLRGVDVKFNPKMTVSAVRGVVNHYSEWNRLMCQIHEEAINGSWGYPDNIASDIGILEHSLGSGSQGMYNDADLVVGSGNGRYSWCQEMAIYTSYRLIRGYDGVSFSISSLSDDNYSYHGWRPALRLIP